MFCAYLVYSCAQPAGQETVLKAGGEAVAEYVRAYEHGKEISELAHYLPLLERKPRSILQARLVQHVLSQKLLHLL